MEKYAYRGAQATTYPSMPELEIEAPNHWCDFSSMALPLTLLLPVLSNGITLHWNGGREVQRYTEPGREREFDVDIGDSSSGAPIRIQFLLFSSCTSTEKPKRDFSGPLNTAYGVSTSRLNPPQTWEGKMLAKRTTKEVKSCARHDRCHTVTSCGRIVTSSSHMTYF